MTIIHRGLQTGPTSIESGTTDKTSQTAGSPTLAQTSTQSSPNNGSSQVEITSAAQLLSNIEQQLTQVPQVDQNRVDAISQALSDGSYQMDSGRTADGLLAAQRFDAQVAGSISGGNAQSTSLQAFTKTAQLE